MLTNLEYFIGGLMALKYFRYRCFKIKDQQIIHLRNQFITKKMTLVEINEH